jgi:hypothetical protein
MYNQIQHKLQMAGNEYDIIDNRTLINTSPHRVNE